MTKHFQLLTGFEYSMNCVASKRHRVLARVSTFIQHFHTFGCWRSAFQKLLCNESRIILGSASPVRIIRGAKLFSQGSVQREGSVAPWGPMGCGPSSDSVVRGFRGAEYVDTTKDGCAQRSTQQEFTRASWLARFNLSYFFPRVEHTEKKRKV